MSSHAAATKWSLNWSLNFEFFLLSDHFEFGVFWMQVSTVLEIKNLTAEGYYSITGSRGLQLRVTKYGKRVLFPLFMEREKTTLQDRHIRFGFSFGCQKKLSSSLSWSVKEQTQKNKTAGKEECTVEVNRKTFKECALDWVKERGHQ